MTQLRKRRGYIVVFLPQNAYWKSIDKAAFRTKAGESDHHLLAPNELQLLQSSLNWHTCTGDGKEAYKTPP